MGLPWVSLKKKLDTSARTRHSRTKDHPFQPLRPKVNPSSCPRDSRAASTSWAFSWASAKACPVSRSQVDP